MDTLSKAIAGIQTALIHFQTVAAGVANRATFRLPQKSKIVRVGASYRVSNATDLNIMVEVDGVDLLTGVIDMVPAAPAAPVCAENPVAGLVELGAHSYRQTFVTATGESVRSAKSNVVTLAAPVAPIALDRIVAGVISFGTHSWKVTFDGPGGESVASAKSNVITLAAPAAPTGTENPINGAVPLGTHSYKVTFTGPDGESVASAKSNVVTLAAPAAPTGTELPEAGDIALGTHSYKVTFVNAGGESVASAKSNVITLAAPTACTAALAGLGAGNVNAGTHSYKVVFVGPGAILSVASAKSNVVTTAGGDGQVALTGIPIGPAGTTDRNIYRTDAGDGAPWRLIGNVGDNIAVIFADNVADGAGAAAPAGLGSKIDVTAIPTGPVGTTERKLYRSAAGDVGPWLLVPTAAALQDNVTVIYSDITADGALGAAAPVALGSRITVSNIPAGPVGTTAREVYRTDAGDAGAWKYVGTVAGNGAAANLADNTPDGGLTSPPVATASTAIMVIPVGPAGTTSRRIFRTDAGDAGLWTLVGTVAGNAAVSFTDTVADAASATVPPAAVAGRLTATIAAGPTGTTSRKVYRTVTGDGGDHKLVATVVGNIVLTLADNVADGALGASAPVSDTRLEGTFSEGVLDDAVAANVAKEAAITVDADTLTGTNVLDLCVQVDMVRLD